MRFIANSTTKVLTILLLLASTTAFQYSTSEGEIVAPKRLVTLNSDEFNRFTTSIYRNLKFQDDTLNQIVFHTALKGYMYLKATNQLENPNVLTIIDFNRYCNSKRLWVIDLNAKKVIFNEMVAHGKRTGDDYANFFSNRHRSNQSSLGFYITGGSYYGSNGLSLKLNGIEKAFNSNAYARGIVIHGANYVGDNYLKYNERIGRSYGCPAVSQQVNKELVNTLKGGSCLFIYHSSKEYNENSQLVNAELYIPMDDLSI